MKYEVLSMLYHNNTEFPIGSYIELNSNEENTQSLLNNSVIKKAPKDVETKVATKPVATFNAPSSTAEIEKAVRKNNDIPDPRAKCPKCKEERNLIEVQYSKKKNTLTLMGKCIACGTRIHKVQGQETGTKKKEEDKK